MLDAVIEMVTKCCGRAEEEHYSISHIQRLRANPQDGSHQLHVQEFPKLPSDARIL